MKDTEQERVASIVLDSAYEVHSWLGPGLLESTYQTCLQYELRERGLFVECEKKMPVVYKGVTIDCGYRIDMVVEHDKLIVENKSARTLVDVNMAQILTYMRLSNIELGFLFNFNVRHFKDGVRRVVLTSRSVGLS
jgi:GxxExxY protein